MGGGLKGRGHPLSFLRGLFSALDRAPLPHFRFPFPEDLPGLDDMARATLMDNPGPSHASPARGGAKAVSVEAIAKPWVRAYSQI
jgi:hypothetical protein